MTSICAEIRANYKAKSIVYLKISTKSPVLRMINLAITLFLEWLRRCSSTQGRAMNVALPIRFPKNGARLGICSLAGLGCLVFSPDCARAQSMTEAGPLVHEFALTLESGRRREIAGPLFYQQETEDARVWGFPPLISKKTRDELDTRKWDILYPILTYSRYGEEYRWQLFQVIAFAGGQSQTDNRKDRITLYPFYLSQRSPDHAEDYTAVLPFYGHYKKHFFRDEGKFILFPLYVQSRKRDVITDNYVYPFFHLRHGDNLRGWQFWPLIGSETKDVVSKKDEFGDPLIIPGHEKSFVLWPFYLTEKLGIGTTNPVDNLAIFPAYASERSPQRDSTTYGWPLWPIYSVADDRAKQYHQWSLFGPFVVFAHGEGKTGQRIWPLFSHMQSPKLSTSFYGWPFYYRTHLTAEPLDRDRIRIMFFLYSDLVEKNLTTGEARKRRDFWPLYTYHRDYNGNERLQCLAILEPLLPNLPGVENNYSPLWSFWRSEKNPKTGSASQSLLWNLYRRETTPETKKCSLFFGLFKYQAGREGKQWRLFYIPFGRHSSTATPATQP